ncbi:DnaJ-domain-containing protein [Exidia glandulosa HHB12029]|uniref:DnaJ-domain-containing protein n=1 Tax=Exidia glandulosa HHB12029 TaxID=1314781 RepID=A0A165CWV7_EXIGL|nr:DnaJ-domain-containing protein [Exidia glandulosa HHB12029]KZV83327.1 DnaJ-domain-containing protein [Exidia glandulosa HHB12029]
MSYYRILNVPRNASRAQIKTSFYKLSKELHPDANPGAANKDKWLEASEAYATLSDDRRRRAYDRDVAHAGSSTLGRSHTHAHTDFAQHPRYHGTYERPKHRATHAWERQGHHYAEAGTNDFAQTRARRVDPLNSHSHTHFSAGRPYYGRRQSDKPPQTTDEDRLREDNGAWRIGSVLLLSTFMMTIASLGLGGFGK